MSSSLMQISPSKLLTIIGRLTEALILFSALTLTVAAQSFAPPVNYTVNNSPFDIDLGDLNGDGQKDLVSTNNTSRNLSVLLNLGSGSFGAKTDYDLGAAPYSSVIADFNSDTKLDVAVTTSSGSTASLRILLGNGDGTLGTPTVFSLPNFSSPNSLAAGDFTGDGKPDFVVTLGGQGVSFIKNVGDGTYVTLSNNVINGFVTNVTTGDFNQDGRLDAACTSTGSSGVVTVFINNGNGTFQTPLSIPTAFSPNAIAVADFNGDAKMDLVTANSNSTINVLLGNGDGTFAGAVSYPANAGNTLAPGDFDLDGKLDLAVGNNADFNIVPGNGDGSFRKAISYQAAGTAITASDLNGDGKLDLVAGSIANTVSVFINQVGPHTISGFIVDQNLASVSGVTVVLTGGTPVVTTTGSDGAFSFVTLTDGGSFVVTPTKVNNVMAPLSRAFNNLAASQITSFTAIQINYIISGVVRDQRGIAMSGVPVTLSGTTAASATSGSDGSYSFPPAPAGGFYAVTASLAGFTFGAPVQISNLTGPRTVNLTGSPVTYTISGLGTGFTNNLSFLTLSGPEKAGYNYPAAGGEYFFSGLQPGNTYTISVSTFLSGRHFSRVIGPPPQTFPNLNSDITANFSIQVLDYPSSINPSLITSGDYNADGKLDVVVAGGGTSGKLQVFLGNGGGGFAGPVTYSVGCVPAGIVTADFDRDGKLDLANTNLCSNNISISRGNGNGTFGAPQQLVTPIEPAALIVGDLNNDTIPDLATLNGLGSTGHTISIFSGVGDGTFSPAATFASSETISLAAADMDNDGDLDLVCGKSSNKINVLYRAANGTYVGGQDYSVPAIPEKLVVGDLNGDGFLDVVTANSNSTNISVLLAVSNASFGNATSFPAGGNSNALSIADFNGDGKLDLTNSISSGESLASLLGNGDGSFQTAVNNLTPTGGTGNVTIGDFNGDGKKDLVATTASGMVSVLLNVIRSAPPLKITGVVATPSGTPLSGITVSVGGSQQFTTTTDVNGNYALNNLQAGGSFVVTASQTFYGSTPSGRMFTDMNSDQVSNFTMTLATPSMFGRVTDINGVALAGVTVNLTGSQTASTVTNASGIYSFMNLTAGGNYTVKPVSASVGFSPTNRSVTNLGFNINQDFRASLDRTIQLDAIDYTTSEGAGSIQVAVTRTGETSAAASVTYSTSDNSSANNCADINGTASSRCDYETTVGTIQFAAGETSKTVTVPIIDDGYAEGSERFKLTLSNAKGGSLGVQNLATITIVDNEIANGANPLSQANFFVNQHYLDFLNRIPDAAGLSFWSNQITECAQPGATCDAGIRRINVSAAFFLSIEFQETGYLVERIYKSAYGDAVGTSNFGPTHQILVPVVRFAEFLPDTQQLGKDVIVGQPGFEQQLENNKIAFTQDFVTRSRFTTAYATSLTPAQFVDALFANTGVTPSASDRSGAINEFGGAGNTTDTAARARVLRRVAENSIVTQQEKNRAFVLMQYFGYLRRNPNDGPDTDHTGYDFWLSKLNQFNGNFVNADMVQAFIVSGEYRQRFGP